MQMGVKYQIRRWIYMGVRLVFLLLIIAGAVNAFTQNSITGNFLFFILVACGWFTTTFLIDLGVRHLLWNDRWYDPLMVCMDVYFFVLAMSLAACTAGLAMLGMAFYTFIVAVISTPVAAFLAGLVGILAFLNGYQLAGQPVFPGLPTAALTVLAAVFCGTAWRLCMPLIWKALLVYLNVTANVAPSAGKPMTDELDQPEEKMPQPSPPPITPPDENAPTEPPAFDSSAASDALVKQLQAKDAALAELSKEKEALAAELAKTNEEMMKLFKV